MTDEMFQSTAVN